MEQQINQFSGTQDCHSALKVVLNYFCGNNTFCILQ